MNVQIRDLSSISISELVQVFNLAFADYAIPISLTVELMELKIVQEHIQLNLSVGIFDEDKIIGFILTGVLWLDGYFNVYNAGTGVIPQYRGQEWTKKMYAFLDQKLKSVQVKQHQLEVLTTNKKAIHLYTTLGFKISRTLSCYKGFIARHEINPKIKIIEEANIEKHVLKTFWTIEPAWQYSLASLDKTNSSNTILGAYLDGILLGYAIINFHKSRILQIAVHEKYRRQGIGSAIMTNILNQFNSKEVTMINVDTSEIGIHAFFEYCGMKIFIEQYEMKRSIQNKI